ncbi:MAG: AAA family ATPase [Sphingopyxis sp.]
MLIGHEGQESAWIRALASGRIAHAWLLAGPVGVGKSAFALRAATFLMMDGDQRAAAGATKITIDGDDSVAQQIASKAHPDFIWLKREVPEAKRPKDGAAGKSDDVAQSITIGQVRAMLARLRMRPVNARWRVVVIDSIDDMERGSTNALLKTLEEPPANTIFLVISHEPGQLLPTIRSRCRMLHFHELSRAEMRQWLSDNVPTASEDQRDALITLAQGSPGRAQLFAGADVSEIAALLRNIAQTGDSDNALRAELARKVSGAGAGNAMAIMLGHANALAADKARHARGDALSAALQVRGNIAALAQSAGSTSADNATIAFVVGSELAGLAGRN